MKKLLLVLCLFFSGVVSASSPIAKLDEFEGGYIDCIENGLKNQCLESVLSGKFIPWADKSKDIQILYGFLSKWMNGVDVYKVHRAGVYEIKGLLQKRFYVIELANGGLASFNVRYRSVKGEWFVLNVEASTNAEAIDEQLGGKLMSPE